MSEQENKSLAPREDVHFKFKFPVHLLMLAILGLLLCAAAIGYFSWMFADFLQHGDLASVYEWIKFVLIYFASIGLAVFLIAMLIRSQYVLTEKELIMQFGLIKQKFALKTIYSVHLFKGANRLAVYFDDFKTKFIIILVKEEWYTEFVRELTARNDHIAFSFSTAEEEEEVKKNGKK